MPADQPSKLERALDRGADNLILDLEDAVPCAAKADARSILAAWLVRQAPRHAAPVRRTGLWVRVNPPERGLLPPAEDLSVAVAPAVSGIVVAKCESPAGLAELDRALAAAEAAAGLQIGHIGVAALIETARGVAALATIAASPRLVRLQIGEADLVADLRMAPDAAATELLPLRLGLVVASAAAGLEAPVGPVYTDLSDAAGLRRSTEQLRRLGFGGRAAIHPLQLAVVNEVFTPGAADVDAALRTLDALDAASAAGLGVAVTDDGHLVDEAVARSARAVLERAGRPPTGDPRGLR